MPGSRVPRLVAPAPSRAGLRRSVQQLRAVLFPSRDSSASAGRPTRRRRRASCLSWGCRPLQSSFFRPRSTRMASGASSVSVPLASADFEVFRDQTTLPNLSLARPPVAGLAVREGRSPEVRLPFRVLPGCTARAALAVFFAPALAGHQLSPALGSASHGVPRPYDVRLRVPRSCRDRLDQPRETRGATPPSGAAPGLRPSDRARLAAPSTRLPLPLGGLSRADSRVPELPRTRGSVVATPLSSWSRSSGGYPPASTPSSLGFALQSFPLPRSRAASRRPSASLRVRRRP
jgi:hypothetical protein